MVALSVDTAMPSSLAASAKLPVRHAVYAVSVALSAGVDVRGVGEHPSCAAQRCAAVGTGAANTILTSARDAQATLVTSSTDAADQIKALSGEIERTLTAAGEP